MGCLLGQAPQGGVVLPTYFKDVDPPFGEPMDAVYEVVSSPLRN